MDRRSRLQLGDSMGRGPPACRVPQWRRCECGAHAGGVPVMGVDRTGPASFSVDFRASGMPPIARRGKHLRRSARDDIGLLRRSREPVRPRHGCGHGGQRRMQPLSPSRATGPAERAGLDQSSNPLRSAKRTSSAVLRTPTLSSTRARWFSAVLALMSSARAISLVVLPSAIRWKTSRSRVVRRP